MEKVKKHLNLKKIKVTSSVLRSFAWTLVMTKCLPESKMFITVDNISHLSFWESIWLMFTNQSEIDTEAVFVTFLIHLSVILKQCSFGLIAFNYFHGLSSGTYKNSWLLLLLLLWVHIELFILFFFINHTFLTNRIQEGTVEFFIDVSPKFDFLRVDVLFHARIFVEY